MFSTAYKNEHIVLFVKQGQDGISMDEFLSDTNSNQTLNISNIVQNKLNYKSQLMDKIYTDQLESVSLSFSKGTHLLSKELFCTLLCLLIFFNQKDSSTL